MLTVNVTEKLVGVTWFCVKVAVTDAALWISFTVQVPLDELTFVDEQLPENPCKLYPELGVAVSVTVVPL